MVLAQPDCSVFDSWLSVESFSRFWLKCFDWLRNKTFFQSSKCFSKNILVSLNFLEIYGQEEMKKEVEFIHGFCSLRHHEKAEIQQNCCGETKFPPPPRCVKEDHWRRQRQHLLPHEVRGCGFDDVKDFVLMADGHVVSWGLYTASHNSSTQNSQKPNQRYKFVVLFARLTPPISLTNYVLEILDDYMAIYRATNF